MDNSKDNVPNPIILNFIEQTLTNFNTLKNELDIQQIKIDEQQKRTADLIPQSITAIGIFVSIIVVLFGGFSIMTSIEAIEEAPLTSLIGVIVVTGQVLFNVVFLMMFLLSRLSERPIHTVCTRFIPNYDIWKRNKENGNIEIKPIDRHCLKCYHGQFCRSPVKLFRKFPYAVMINMLFFATEIVLLIIVFIQFLYISDFIIIENYLGVAFSLLGIPIIIFILLMLTLFINFGYKLDNNSIINKRNTPEHTEENEKIELNKKRRTTMIVIMGGINFLLFFVSVGILLYSIKIL